MASVAHHEVRSPDAESTPERLNVLHFLGQLSRRLIFIHRRHGHLVRLRVDYELEAADVAAVAMIETRHGLHLTVLDLYAAGGHLQGIAVEIVWTTNSTGK